MNYSNPKAFWETVNLLPDKNKNDSEYHENLLKENKCESMIDSYFELLMQQSQSNIHLTVRMLKKVDRR